MAFFGVNLFSKNFAHVKKMTNIRYDPSQCWIVWKDEGNGIDSDVEAEVGIEVDRLKIRIPHSVPQWCFFTFMATQRKPLWLDFKLDGACLR